MKTYRELWAQATRLRSDPKSFVQAYLELQAELNRELEETLRVSCGVKIAEGRVDD